MYLEDFNFDVPDRLIAHAPVEPRDHARLLIRRGNGLVKHSIVRNLANELEPGSLLVINDSRVFPSRLFAKTTHGGSVELFLIDSLETGRWRILARPLKKLKPGVELYLSGGIVAKVESREEQFAIIKLPLDDDAVFAWLENHAFIPLPPYIHRENNVVACKSKDKESYQTVYAKEVGSVAAPTAGLHFTAELLSNIKKNQCDIVNVCLHVGAGTFLPVKTEQIDNHKMHVERIFVPLQTMQKILEARKSGRPVISIGTTTFRALESLVQIANGDLSKIMEHCGKWQETSIFIHPEHPTDIYSSQLVDALWTNFHQPKSTLFMLISALIGLAEAQRIYKLAIENNYRFFSYGDASLLWLNDLCRREF